MGKNQRNKQKQKQKHTQENQKQPQEKPKGVAIFRHPFSFFRHPPLPQNYLIAPAFKKIIKMPLELKLN